jgi:transposase-like protein
MSRSSAGGSGGHVRTADLRKWQLNAVDEIVRSLYVKGTTTGKLSAHFAKIYGGSVSKGDDEPDH